MIKKVAVFAGTLVDTKMGAVIVEKLGIQTLEYPFSKTPEEQTKMQYFSRDELNQIFKRNVEDAKNRGAEKIFVYCNSLSLAVDYEQTAKELEIQIITPLETYKNLQNVTNLAIIAANGFSAYALDKLVGDNNTINSSITFGNMPLVKSIEAEDENLIETLNLKGYLNYLEAIKGDYKIDTLILGCTHFSYITEEIKKMTTLNVIDPTENMIKELMKE